jgi:putative ABC transport system substrate-binding protein
MFPERRLISETGALTAYGAGTADGFRQAGIYAGRILNGEKPSDLPVQQSTKVALAMTSRPRKPSA